MATNSDATWEVIDGLQRISTIIRFAADLDSEARKIIGKLDCLKLTELDKLSMMNGMTMSDMASD